MYIQSLPVKHDQLQTAQSKVEESRMHLCKYDVTEGILCCEAGQRWLDQLAAAAILCVAVCKRTSLSGNYFSMWSIRNLHAQIARACAEF